MLGGKAFFEMMMQHNFVHADCHGGNIFVNIVPYSSLSWFKAAEIWLYSQWNRLLMEVMAKSLPKKLSILCNENILY